MRAIGFSAVGKTGHSVSAIGARSPLGTDACGRSERRLPARSGNSQVVLTGSRLVKRLDTDVLDPLSK